MGKKSPATCGRRIKYSIVCITVGIILVTMATACNVQNPPVGSYETFPQTTAKPDSSSGSVHSTPAVSENKEIVFKDVNK